MFHEILYTQYSKVTIGHEKSIKPREKEREAENTPPKNIKIEKIEISTNEAFDQPKNSFHHQCESCSRVKKNTVHIKNGGSAKQS